jgi:hypothetical protein
MKFDYMLPTSCDDRDDDDDGDDKKKYFFFWCVGMKYFEKVHKRSFLYMNRRGRIKKLW